jgi:tetratricopeptide (TPR) repeat protein
MKAHVGLALSHVNGYRWGWSEASREESLELAFKHANKAVALAPFDHTSHWIVGKINKHAGNLDKAVVEYNKAMELNPNDAEMLAESADLLIDLGQAEEAVVRVQTAMRLNPRHADWLYWSLGDAQYFAGECEATLTSYRRMNNMPNGVKDNVAMALACLDRVEEARAVIEEFLEKEPDYTLEEVKAGSFFKNSKTRMYAERRIEDLRAAGVPEK